MKIALLLSIRSIRSKRYKTSDFIVTLIYLPRKKDRHEVLGIVRRELYIVNSLRAYILIRNNIIGPKGISIDIANKRAYIASYKIIIDIEPR